MCWDIVISYSYCLFSVNGRKKKRKVVWMIEKVWIGGGFDFKERSRNVFLGK